MVSISRNSRSTSGRSAHVQPIHCKRHGCVVALLSTSPVRNAAQSSAHARRGAPVVLGVPPDALRNLSSTMCRSAGSFGSSGCFARCLIRRSDAAARRAHRSIEFRLAGWRHASLRRLRPAPSGQGSRYQRRRSWSTPHRDNSWRCRPCCNARSATPGWARA